MMMCWSNKWIIEQRSIHNDGGNTAAAADKLLQQSSLSTPSLLSNLLSTPLNFAPGSLPPHTTYPHYNTCHVNPINIQQSSQGGGPGQFILLKKKYDLSYILPTKEW